MSTAQPRFNPEQTTAAIRAAYSPRWDTSLAVADAVALASTYRSIQAHYRQHVQRSLSENDFLQVAEKSWGAFTQAVKSIGADHQIKLSSHVGIFRVAGELAALIGQTDPDAAHTVNQAATVASSLHTHFYENNLTDAMVAQSAAAVSEAIDLLQDWFPPSQDIGAAESV